MPTDATLETEGGLPVTRLRPRRLPRPHRNRMAAPGVQPQPPTGWISQKVFDKRGHALTYVGLLLFTIVVYFKPQDFLHFDTTPNIAFLLAITTVLLYIPTQLKLEGRLTARTRELDVLLVFAVLALLSMPLAISRSDSWTEFNDMFLKAVLMFIVIINVVRTEARLKGLLYIALAVALVSGGSALNNHRLGLQTLEGYRTTGILGGILQDPNDMSLFIVTVIPLTIALLLGSKNLLPKLFYALAVLIMVGGIAVTYSRGGFLGLIAMAGVLTWKVSRRQPLAAGLAVVGILAFVALAPGNYANRLASITNPELDSGAATERRELLYQSVQVALHNPVFGVGMGNFHLTAFRDKPTHNAYTQVASEMGFPALIIYVAFMVVPFIQLRKIEKETFGVPGYERIYTLAVCLQASLIGYMASSFFLSVAFYWFIYYLVGYAVCLRRIYETGPGRVLGKVTIAPVKQLPAEDAEDDYPQPEEPVRALRVI